MSPSSSGVGAAHDVPTDRRDVGPRVTLEVAAVAGLVALGLGATFLGVTLVLLALAGGVATAVGPLSTRREARAADIVVPRWVGADAQALATEQRRLRAQLADADQVASAVRPRLAAHVAARLARRGVDPGSAEARALLGAPLAAFLTGTDRASISPAAFAALLTRVEAL